MPNKPHLPPDKYRGTRVNIRWTEPEYKALVKLAQMQGLNVPKFIRKCVQEWARDRQVINTKKGELPDLI